VSLRNTFKSLNSSQFPVFIGLMVLALALAFGTARFGQNIGLLSILIIVGFPFLFLILANVRFGFFVVLVLTFFISFINRMSNYAVPILAVEIILILVIVGMLLQEISNPKIQRSFWAYYKNPIAIALLLWAIYNHFQFLNPNSSNLEGKIIAIRQSWFNLLGFTVALHVFADMKNIKAFFKIVITVSLLAALYGLSQKYIGLLPYDRDWLYASPIRMNLFIVWEGVRTWSFMNDPTNFGLLMGSTGIICFILITGPYLFYKKVLLGVSGSLMFLAMVGSGTRTAFVVVLVGFGMFGLLNIKSLRTQVISVTAILISLIIYFGPFYGASIVRFRSAFKGSEDPSMNVRLINKERIKPYLFSHPIGGGPNTTGGTKEMGHALSGFPPDSGYLRVALELGYIGLIITLWLYYKASAQLTSQFFQTTNTEKKTLYLAILASMMALCTAEVTQITINQKPFDFFFFSYFALIIRLKDIPDKT
jgi:putative inorganic carbon (hco3(-)) transporter